MNHFDQLRAWPNAAGLIAACAVGLASAAAPAIAAGSVAMERAATQAFAPSALEAPIRTEAPILLAGKISSAVKGAAVGSRAGRAMSKSREEKAAENEEAPAANADAGSPASDENVPSDTANSGPFKLTIPGPGGTETPAQGAEAKPPAAATAPAAPAQSATQGGGGAVRTLLDRSAAGAAPAAEQGAAQAAVDDPSCVAGCYATTSARTSVAPIRRAGQGPVAPAARKDGIECIAGCDGIEGSTIPRATTSTAAMSAPGSDGGASNRVTILRGVTRKRQYGVN